MKVYSALEIAKFIIHFCLRQLRLPISNLQLNKILYFIQRESIRIRDIPAFYDDIIAWKFGTVVPNVYYEFSPYAGRPILREFPDVEIKDSTLKSIIVSLAYEGAQLSAWQLVKLSQTPGTAWDRVYNQYGTGSVIPISEIRKDVLNK